MEKQSEAESLADGLERCLPNDSYELRVQTEAAAELRRLHAENEGIKTAIRAAGYTLVKTQFAFALMKLGPIEAQGALDETSKDQP